MKDKTVISGWALKGLVTLFLIGASARGKFVAWEGKQEMFDKMGFSTELMVKIGILEVLVTLLFLLPGRLGVLGAILLSSYLGGAVVTHVRVGDPFIFPVIVGIIAWISIALSDTEFRAYFLKK